MVELGGIPGRRSCVPNGVASARNRNAVGDRLPPGVATRLYSSADLLQQVHLDHSLQQFMFRRSGYTAKPGGIRRRRCPLLAMPPDPYPHSVLAQMQLLRHVLDRLAKLDHLPYRFAAQFGWMVFLAHAAWTCGDATATGRKRRGAAFQQASITIDDRQFIRCSPEPFVRGPARPIGDAFHRCQAYPASLAQSLVDPGDRLIGNPQDKHTMSRYLATSGWPKLALLPFSPAGISPLWAATMPREDVVSHASFRCGRPASGDADVMTVSTTLAGVPALLRVPRHVDKPPIILWHGFGPPANEASLMQALPLDWVAAVKVYLGLSLFGRCAPPGGTAELRRRASRALAERSDAVRHAAQIARCGHRARSCLAAALPDDGPKCAPETPAGAADAAWLDVRSERRRRSESRHRRLVRRISLKLPQRRVAAIAGFHERGRVHDDSHDGETPVSVTVVTVVY